MANTFTDADFVNAGNPFPVGLRWAVLYGAKANTDNPVPGIDPEDKIVYAMVLDKNPAAKELSVFDMTHEVVISSVGNVKMETDTETDKIWLCWYDKSGGETGNFPNIENSPHEALRYSVVEGAAINTDMPLEGITMSDKLLFVLHYNLDDISANVDWNDGTAECCISSDGCLQCSKDIEGDKLLVMWYDVAGGTAVVSTVSIVNAEHSFASSYKVCLVDAAAPGVDMPVDGIGMIDVVAFAMSFTFDTKAEGVDSSAVDLEDVTAKLSIPSDGNVQLQVEVEPELALKVGVEVAPTMTMGYEKSRKGAKMTPQVTKEVQPTVEVDVQMETTQRRGSSLMIWWYDYS